MQERGAVVLSINSQMYFRLRPWCPLSLRLPPGSCSGWLLGLFPNLEHGKPATKGPPRMLRGAPGGQDVTLFPPSQTQALFRFFVASLCDTGDFR